MKKSLSIISLILASLTLTAWTGCRSDHDHAGHEHGKELCPVSGEALGSMGDPHIVTHEGVQVKLCCKNCEADFQKEPKKYIEKLHKH